MWFRVAIIAMMALLASGPSHAQEAGGMLQRLFAKEWEAGLRRDPVLASSLGDKRYQSLWADESLVAKARENEEDQAFMAELKTIPPDQLSAVDQVNYRLFERTLADRMERYRMRWHLVPLNQRGGIQTAEQIADEIRFESLQDYRDWLARIDAFPTYMDQTIALMRAGIDAKLVHARVIMERIPAQIDSQIVADPALSNFFKPFQSMPADMPERDALIEAAKRSWFPPSAVSNPSLSRNTCRPVTSASASGRCLAARTCTPPSRANSPPPISRRSRFTRSA